MNGTVFSAATLVGLDLIGLLGPDLAKARRRGEKTLALLPQRGRKCKSAAGDDDVDLLPAAVARQPAVRTGATFVWVWLLDAT